MACWKRPHRVIRASRTHADDAQLRHRWSVRGIELEDASVAGFRAAKILSEDRQIAEPAQGLDVIGHELQHLLAGAGGFRVVPLLNVYFGERQQWLRKPGIVARGALEHRRGVRQTSGESEVVAQHDGVLRSELAVRFELTQVGDRKLVPAGGRVGDGARTPRHQQVRILGEHRGELANRDVRFDTRRRHPSIQPRQELHAVLWIAQRPTLRRHWCTPAHVAERPEPLDRLGIDRRSRRGSGPTERSVERLRSSSTRAGCSTARLVVSDASRSSS